MPALAAWEAAAKACRYVPEPGSYRTVQFVENPG